MKSNIPECPIIGYSLENMKGQQLAKPAFLDSSGNIVINPDTPFQKGIIRVKAFTKYG